MAPDGDIDIHDRLDGQTALVTGANRGIGEQIAAELQALGATVYAGARDPAEITADGQQALTLDITDDGQIREAARQLEDAVGTLDILVNNAGVIGPQGALADLAMDEVDRVLRTNLRGPLALTRAVIPLLLAAEIPRVVNVTSGAGSFGEGMMTSHLPYAISKAGMNALTVNLHAQYHDQGLIVNSVCPGWVRTDMGGQDAHRSVEKGAETPVWLSRFRSGSPSGRFWRDRAPIPW